MTSEWEVTRTFRDEHGRVITRTSSYYEEQVIDQHLTTDEFIERCIAPLVARVRSRTKESR